MTDTLVDQDIVDILTTDHHEILDLVQHIKITTDAEERRDLADTFISELVRHSVAEEMSNDFGVVGQLGRAEQGPDALCARA
jgi:hypothetical protein